MRKKFVFLSLIITLSLVVLFLFYRNFDGSGQLQSEYSVQVAFPNLSFSAPVGLVTAKDGTSRLFVIEQEGTIRVFSNSENATSSSVFLDLRDRVLYGGEQGLLGLAFHPNFKNNGYFYVNYVVDNPRRTIIARFTVNPNIADQADQTSELVLLEVSQPFANHNGGQLAFGPDGYLYIGLGDGGSGGDPLGNGQNRSTLLGKILRIDVNSPASGRNYGIPSDNPFAGNALGYREEIFAFGFRNPWRFSFDAVGGTLWAADVGQSQREEIDIVEKGNNYGWNIMEGSIPYSGGDQTGLTLPVWEYGRDEGIAVIGGFVYHGPTLTGLADAYVYGDYGSGKIWALTVNGSGTPTNTLLIDTNLVISSFGFDSDNELYICAFDGKIYRLHETIIPEFPSLVAFAVLLVALVLTLVVFKGRMRYISG